MSRRKNNWRRLVAIGMQACGCHFARTQDALLTKELRHRRWVFHLMGRSLPFRRHPSLKTIGHTISCPTDKACRNHDFDVERVAQTITRTTGVADESDILPAGKPRHAPDRVVNRGTNGKTGAGMIRMTRPRIMRDGIDQRSKTIH